MAAPGGSAPEGFADGWRRVFGNDPEQFARGLPYAQWTDNIIITSHYTAINFVPRFLIEQFRRFANAYFLVVCILQMIPAISITGGVPTSLLPLASVIVFDGVVTAVEDYRRHQDDAANNAKPVKVCRNGMGFEDMTWANLQVGDIVRINRGEQFPADLLFLRSFTASNDIPNACYVQTAQLDGETNLKLRQTKPQLVDMFNSDAACAAFRGFLDCEPPNEFFGRFTGALRLTRTATNAEAIPLEGKDPILLRGCVLRNVDYVYALVMYTGDQTKVRVAQKNQGTKRASVEKVINRNILVLVGLLVVLCIVGTVGFSVWTGGRWSTHYYLGFNEGVTFGSALIKVFTFFLLNAAFIPVSLYVSMKMARTGQKFFMEMDGEMYHEDTKLCEQTDGAEGCFPMRVRTMDLNDELGQISHIFSDKTGTFTLNYMELRKLAINGRAYGLGTTQIGLDRLKRTGADTRHMEELCRQAEEQDKPVPHVNFLDGSETHPGQTLFGELKDITTEQGNEIHQFLLHLVLNQTVIPETRTDKHGNEVKALSASSPDEEAFVYAGQFFGYEFVARDNEMVTIKIGDKLTEFKILDILNYTNARKRMSVIVQHPDGRIFLYLKGADSKIFERLAKPRNKTDSETKETTDRILNDWGNDGLRTLCFAYKEIPAEVYRMWSRCYNSAKGDLNEIKLKKAKKTNQIDELANLIEEKVYLQGATANEDKLQPKVPETIETLARGGIKIWMLTGDKEETAINIGYATRMLNDDQTHLRFSSASIPSHKVLFQKLAEEARAVEAGTGVVDPVTRQVRARALIIDEANLDHCLNKKKKTFNEKSKNDLLVLANACKAVICCRARPDQKAALVKMIRDGVPGVRTLAIGDGANDVDMIQTAHVGVGIAGAEGVQAANASDFSIGRFRFLQRLLLVHGRNNYRRMAKLVCYMFYKNIVMVLAQFWYTILTGWSGQKFYIELAAQSFNLVYTGPPILILGLLDKDVSDASAQLFPKLYADGPKGERFNVKIFWGWVLQAVFESLVCLFVCALTMQTVGVDNTGSPYTFELGTWVFTSIILVTSLRIALEMQQHTMLYQVWLFLSVIAWVPFLYFFDVLNANGMKGGASRMFSSWLFYIDMLLICVVCMIRPFLWKMWRRWFNTEYRHLVQEVELLTQNPDALVAFDAPKEKKPLAKSTADAVAASNALVTPLVVTPGAGGAGGAGAGASAASGGIKHKTSRHLWHKAIKEVRATIEFRNRHTGTAFSQDVTGTAMVTAALDMGGSMRGPSSSFVGSDYLAQYVSWLSDFEGRGGAAKGAGAGAGAGAEEKK